MKSEPETFGIGHLEKVKAEPWTGVRNYQARNFMRKEMRLGDSILFYHSNVQPPGIAGLAKVVSEPYPDPTQFDPKSEYFDEKSTEAKPRWWLVDVSFVAKFLKFLTLAELKGDAELQEMIVCRKGSRLSIMPVTAPHFKRVCKLAGWKQ